jgi:hypothetical protein
LTDFDSRGHFDPDAPLPSLLDVVERRVPVRGLSSSTPIPPPRAERADGSVVLVTNTLDGTTRP